VLVTGEGGIGKSQLVDTLRSRIGREGFTRIVFRYSPYQQSSALLPVITHLLPRVIGRPPAGTAIIPASDRRIASGSKCNAVGHCALFLSKGCGQKFRHGLTPIVGIEPNGPEERHTHAKSGQSPGSS
jgi:predicted ATPase